MAQQEPKESYILSVKRYNVILEFIRLMIASCMKLEVTSNQTVCPFFYCNVILVKHSKLCNIRFSLRRNQIGAEGETTAANMEASLNSGSDGAFITPRCVSNVQRRPVCFYKRIK